MLISVDTTLELSPYQMGLKLINEINSRSGETLRKYGNQSTYLVLATLQFVTFEEVIQ